MTGEAAAHLVGDELGSIRMVGDSMCVLMQAVRQKNICKIQMSYSYVMDELRLRSGAEMESVAAI